MNKILLVFVVVFFLGCLAGLFVLNKYFAAKRSIGYVNHKLNKSHDQLEYLTDLMSSRYSTKMVFLHHSVGRNLLNTGGLRAKLLDYGIFVAGATSGGEIGAQTDVSDWLPKFENDMQKIITYKSHPNRYYTDGTKNEIVMFKSCYPNSDITSEGELPGDPFGTERTTANYKATFTALKREMMENEDTLFIYMTAPPLSPQKTSQENAERARKFNNWLINEFLVEYTKESRIDNLVVFDLFDYLAGSDNCLKEEYRRDRKGDSHPNEEASRLAAEAFIQYFIPVWENWQNKIGNKTTI